MKFSVHFLFTVLAATVAVAAPARHLQVPLASSLAGVPDKGDKAGKHRHLVTTSTSTSTNTHASMHTDSRPHAEPKKFKLPYVVKVSLASTVTGATLDKSRKTPSTSDPTLSWLKKWRGMASQEAGSGEADTKPAKLSQPTKAASQLSCFCAGGSICCHTLNGLDCNAGYCGI